jgi:hypothetical protein
MAHADPLSAASVPQRVIQFGRQQSRDIGERGQMFIMRSL